MSSPVGALKLQPPMMALVPLGTGLHRLALRFVEQLSQRLDGNLYLGIEPISLSALHHLVLPAAIHLIGCRRPVECGAVPAELLHGAAPSQLPFALPRHVAVGIELCLRVGRFRLPIITRDAGLTQAASEPFLFRGARTDPLVFR
eukprot:2925738-Prymnesium_polylepis.1